MITLTTDFGTADPYVGVMKGVILGINPRASFVDISHQIEPQSISEGAFIIGSSHKYFPKDTIHVVVVDPGVGTERKALLLVTPHASFVAPDNGILSYVLAEGFEEEPNKSFGSQVTPPPGYKAYHLNNEEFWLNPVSSTFHGRDIFAPVAAHLSRGVPAHELGQETKRVTWLNHRQPYRDGTVLVGQVVHIDRFGNLITNIRADLFAGQGPITVDVKGHRIPGLDSSYEAGACVLAIVGSHGALEISVRNGSAAESLKAQVGDPVRVDSTD